MILDNENIVNVCTEVAGKIAEKIAKETDEYAIRVFAINSWLLKRKRILKIWAKLNRLRIVDNQQTGLQEFWKNGKKVGQLKINYKFAEQNY